MKTVLRLGMVVLVAAAIGGAVWKQNAVGAARAEQQTLQSQSEEMRRLEEQNKDIARLREENGELEKLRAENKDLPKLRNEVRQLRRQAEELERLQAENKAMKNGTAVLAASGRVGIPKKVFLRGEWKDAGLDFPWMTLETYFWATSTGNFQRFRDCMTPEAAAAVSVLTPENFGKMVQDRMGDFTGYEIVNRKMDNAGEVLLTVKVLPDGETKQMRFIQTAGEGWKMGP